MGPDDMQCVTQTHSPPTDDESYGDEKRVRLQLCQTPGCQKPWCGTFSATNRCSAQGCQNRAYKGMPRSFCSVSCVNQTTADLDSAITAGDHDQLIPLIQSLDGVRNWNIAPKVTEAKQLLQLALIPRVASNGNNLVSFAFANLGGDEVAIVSAKPALPLTKFWEIIAKQVGVYKWQVSLLLWGERALLESDIVHSFRNVADLLREMNPELATQI